MRHDGVQAPVSEWVIEVKLDAAALKETDPLPASQQWMVQTHLPEAPRIQVYTALVDLVSNAVEHGLLRMDSSLKNRDDGFEKYYGERNARLQSLAAGHLRVRLEQRPVPGGRAIKICVEDLGRALTYRRLSSRWDQRTSSMTPASHWREDSPRNLIIPVVETKWRRNTVDD